MNLRGANIIGGQRSAEGKRIFLARNPATGATLEPGFHEATPGEIDEAALGATEAFHANRRRPPEERAALLEDIGEEIEALGDRLVERVSAETALPEGRVLNERGRTVNQLRMFAQVVREGSWVEARIDRPMPDREPVPKPDIRRMLIPLGPVAVFGASNFPLAFSVAGGDTASALAAGCPVIVKSHPSHPGTSELVGEAILAAIERAGFHPHTFSLLHGTDPGVSLGLVMHPAVKAVGFTGSLRAGRSIYDAAVSRPEPIPVYAEMGSVNPVFILPGAAGERGDTIAEGLVQSFTLGSGQFCTSPGLVFGRRGDDLADFSESLGRRIEELPVFTMLNEGICRAFNESVHEFEHQAGVRVLRRTQVETGGGARAGAAVFATDVRTFFKNGRLSEEVFGPSTLLVECDSAKEFLDLARRLEGNLTATIHGTDQDLAENQELVEVLENKVGRLIFNGYPTGVEVCASMHHGGPYPASTDVRATSVGTAAIHRFARPVCYQGFPSGSLPPELQDRNERGIWRLVDNELTRADVTG